MDGRNLMIAPASEGHFSFEQIDLTDVSTLALTAGSQHPLKQGYRLVVKLDGPEGTTIGETTIEPKNSNGQDPFNSATVSVKISPVTDGKLHDLYFFTEPLGEDEITMALLSLELKVE